MSSRVTTSPGRASISDSSWNGWSCRRTASLPRRTSRRRMSTSTSPNCTTGLETSWLTMLLVWPRAPPVTSGVSVMWPRFRPVSPSCHLGGIEARGGGAHCWGMSMLAAALMVTIRVYDVYGLSPETRQEALALAAETLAHAGVQADHRRLQCRRRRGHAVQDGPRGRRDHAPHPAAPEGRRSRPRRRHRSRRCRPEHHRHGLRRGDRRTVQAHRHAPGDDRRPRHGARDRAPAARHRTPTPRTA